MKPLLTTTIHCALGPDGSANPGLSKSTVSVHAGRTRACPVNHSRSQRTMVAMTSSARQ